MRENKELRGARLTGAITIATLILGLGASAAPGVAHAAQRHTSDQGAVTVATTTAVAGPTSVAAAGTRTTLRWARAVDTSAKSAVNAAYWSAYAPRLTQLVDWIGGSVLGCLPGLSSLTSNTGTLSALNFVRSMAGLAPVTFSPTLNSTAQKAALMMTANGNLSHNPSSSWKCWTSDGAKSASRSNLALAYPTLKAGQVIDLYMDDPGSTNTAAGHRRWILNPFSTVMGSGSTDVANALTVIGPSSASRPNPRWVGWPTAGYFPNALEPDGRWSLSAGLSSMNFTYAKIAVYRGTTQIPVRKYTVHSGYGQPTLVWQMPANFNRTGSYGVVVTGIRKAGTTKRYTARYMVRLFTPSR